MVGAAGLGRGSTLWGALGPTGSPVWRSPSVWGGVDSPRILSLTRIAPSSTPAGGDTHPPPPKTLGSERRVGRFSTHLRRCRWGQGTKVLGERWPPRGCGPRSSQGEPRGSRDPLELTRGQPGSPHSPVSSEGLPRAGGAAGGPSCPATRGTGAAVLPGSMAR